MFGGPYELGICVDAVCDCAAPAEEPSRSWHILNASMSQLPAAAGDSCMLSKPVCGAGALLLEHDATQIAIAIVTTNREMQDPVIIGFRSWGFAPGFRLPSTQPRPCRCRCESRDRPCGT